MTNQENLPETPEKTRLYAIGDVHGRLDLLHALLDLIEADAQKYPHRAKELVFLGDYVDRGVNSKGVIDCLLHDLPRGFKKTFLRGNHDDAFLRFIKGDLEILSGWMLLGGTATLASYGVNPFRSALPADEVHARLMENLPPEHIAFLEGLPYTYEAGDYLFVHAGIKPSVALEDQTTEDMLWIRNEFLTSAQDFGKVIVHGHTAMPAPEMKSNRIGIDTGAYATGHLTALVLQDSMRGFLAT